MQRKRTKQEQIRLIQLLNGTGMPLGNSASWNGGAGGGGMGQSWGGGWGGYYGNGSGMGGGMIGYGTGGAINPNK